MRDVRLLHKDSTRGYTDQLEQALPHEPEAIAEEEQRAISIQARSAFAQERAEESWRRDTKAWADRLRKVETRAHNKGLDCFRHTAAVRREIMAMERLCEDAA